MRSLLFPGSHIGYPRYSYVTELFRCRGKLLKYHDKEVENSSQPHNLISNKKKTLRNVARIVSDKVVKEDWVHSSLRGNKAKKFKTFNQSPE